MAVSGSDIQLLFGVAGEGSVDDGSGALIRRQLNQIVAKLNDASHTKERQIRLTLDMANTRQALAKSIDSLVSQVSGQNKFKIKLASIDASAAIKDFQAKIQGVLNTLQIKNGMTVSVTDFNKGGTITGDAGGTRSLDEATQRARDYAVQLSTIKNLMSGLNSTEGRLFKVNGADAEQVADLTRRIQELRSRMEAFRNAKNQPNQAFVDEVVRETAALNQEVAALRGAAAATREKADADSDAEAAMERMAVGSTQYNNAIRQTNTALAQAEKNLRSWTKARHGRSSMAYAGIEVEVANIKSLSAELASGTMTQEQFAQRMSAINMNLRGYYATIQRAGEATRSFLDRMGGLASKFGAWFSLTRVIMSIVRTIRRMITSVVELDSAMTQLKIVTGASDAQMSEFLSSSTSLAKELGKSITEVLKSVETFSRLGYDLDESSILAKYTAVLSNVAGVSTDEATTGVTSIIKGFNMDVSNTEHVADVLIEVGQKYAVSAGELMEAFARSGAALNATNTSFEKSAGLIAAANASVQDASTVGTALKTVSARIRGSKSDLDELGESTEDLANGFSKYADEIKALTGFDIMVDGTKDQFKDIYDIFEGLAGVWDKLSDTQQARVSEILGGTRQLQVISSILGNWDDAAGAYESAMESAGTATEAQGEYIDSIQGKIDRFRATFQDLSQDLFNSGVLKFFVDLGTGILSVVDALTELNLLLPMVASTWVAIKGIRAGMAAMRTAETAMETASMLTTMSSSITRIVAEKGSIDALAASVATLTVAEKAELAAKLQTQMASAGMSATLIQETLETLGLAGAEGVLAGANHTLGASFKALMASIPVWGWIALGISALIPVVTALASSFKSNEERLEDLNAEYEELRSEISSITNEYQSLRQSAEKVIPEFAELAQGVNEFGENVSLTDDKYARFLELNNQIAEMFPELNLGMDSNGNYMLALSYSSDTLTESLRKQLDMQRELAAQDLADTMPDVLDNVNSTVDVLKDEEDALKGRLATYDELGTKIKAAHDEYGTWEKASYYSFDDTEIALAAQRVFDASHHNDSWVKLLETYTKTVDGLQVIDWDALVNSVEFQDAVSGIYAELDNLGERIPYEFTKLNPVVSAWLSTDFQYNELSDSARNVAQAMVRGLDFSSLGLTTKEQVEDYIRNNILSPLYNAGPEVSNAFKSISSWQEELKNGEITEEEFAKRTRDAFSKLIDGMDPSKVEEFKTMFVTGFRAMGFSGATFEAMVEDVIRAWGKLESAGDGNPLDGMQKTIDSITKIDAAKEEIDKVGKALGQFKESGAIGADFLEPLTESFGKLDSFQNFVNVLTDSTSTMEEAQQAADALGTEWVNQIGLLDNLTTENADAVAAMLEMIGVTNAQEVVSFRLSAARYMELVATENCTDAMRDEAAQILVNCGAAASAEEAMQKFAKAQDDAKNAAKYFNDMTAQQIGTLLAQAKAAGISGKAINALVNLMSFKQKLENNPHAYLNANEAALVAQWEEDAKSVIGLTEMAVKVPAIKIDVSSIKPSGSTKDSKDDKETEKSTKEVEKYIAELDRLYNKKEQLRQQELKDSRLADQIARTDESSIDGLKERIRLTGDYIDGLEEENRLLHGISGAMRESKSAELQAVGDQMLRDFGGGNVDLLNRKQVPMDDGGYATVETSWMNEFIGGKELAIHYTPIVDGEFLDDEELNSYLNELYDGAQSAADILSRDSIENGGLGIVMRVKADFDFDEESDWDQRLHEAQERYYDLKNIVGDSPDALYDWETSRAEILEKIAKFEENYGLKIQYNPETNDLMFNDLLKIQELREDSSKTYETEADRQEAQNKRIKQAEQDWDDIKGLVEDCRDRSAQWEENEGKKYEELKNQLDMYKQIVEVASSMVDEVQNVYEILQKASDEYAANDGFISVDTFQEITSAGLEYMQYLTDENGLLKINRDSINAVIKAKTEQMALEAADSYVKRVIASTTEDAIESTDRLTLATDKLTQSTWAYLETQLYDLHQNGKLTDEQYAGALENLRNYRMILTGVRTDFQSHADEMTKANEAMDKILEYTIELIKQQVQDEIDGINELVESYKELIEAKKEALNQTKEEEDYADELLEKSNKLAKLKSEEVMLRLAVESGDRSANAKLVKNLEEQGEIQKDIDKTQRDHSIKTQEEALDQMAEDYEDEKNEEIRVLENSISSQEKLFSRAIAYIDEHWDTLYADLIGWNSEYGSTINQEITQNWVLATNAVEAYKKAHEGIGSFTDVIKERNDEQYGTYDTTVNEDGTSTVTQTNPTTNDTVASSKALYSQQYFDARAAGNYQGMKDANDSMNNIRIANGEEPQYANYDIVKTAVGVMKANDGNGAEGSNEVIKDWINNTYPELGVYNAGGIWYLADGRRLYDVYHTGGIVGGGTLHENEQMAIVQKGEPIISNAHKRDLFDLVEFAGVLSSRLGNIDPAGFDLISSARNERLAERLMEASAGSAPSIQFGNVYIYGANDETVRKHEEVNRKFANEVLKYLNVKP